MQNLWIAVVAGTFAILGAIAGNLTVAWKENRRWLRELEREDIRWTRERERDADRRAHDRTDQFRDTRIGVYGELLAVVRECNDLMDLAASIARQGVDPIKIAQKLTEKVEDATKVFGRAMLVADAALQEELHFYPRALKFPDLIVYDPTPTIDGELTEMEKIERDFSEASNRLYDYHTDLLDLARKELGTTDITELDTPPAGKDT